MLRIKQLFLAAMASILVISCDSKKEVSLNGNIENNTADSIYLINNDIRKSIPISNGAFSDTINIAKPGYFKFYAGNQFAWLYLTPGAELTMKTDMNKFDDQLKFEGKLSNENNFLAKKTVKQIAMSGNPSEFFKQDAVAFKQKIGNYKSELLADLEKSKASNSFKESEKKNIEFEYLLMLAQYPQAYSFFTQKETEMPADFEKELSAVNLDNEEDFELLPSYKDLVLYQISRKIDEVGSGDEVEKIIANIKSQNIKDGIMSQLLMYTISSGGPNAQKYYDIVQKYSQDDDLKKRAATEFEQVKRLLPGSPSPEFIYPDINGKDVALSDLKGKLVYIDVWATWCVPCLQEIPSLKKLESDYHGKDIYFVSMSVDQKKDFEKWQNMVKEKELQGIQIFSDNDWKSQFVKDYNINGIPRFILLDREGKIISADAPRPSDPNIRLLIDEKI
ncbi:MAG: TlpA disulfide reductase family protein [Moheibacter sp.]